MDAKIDVKGLFRLQIGEDKNGKTVVKGDSGWVKNTITESGFDDYIVGAIGGIAGSSQILGMALATQSTAVNSTQTSLNGETNGRKTPTNSLVGNGTLQCTASWSSTDNGGACDIGSLALYHTSAAGGSMAAGQTFESSTWATNQNVSATYQLQFSPA